MMEKPCHGCLAMLSASTLQGCPAQHKTHKTSLRCPSEAPILSHVVFQVLYLSVTVSDMRGLLSVNVAVQVQRFALSAFLTDTWTADAVEGLDLSMFPDVVLPSLIATGMADLFSVIDEGGFAQCLILAARQRDNSCSSCKRHDEMTC